MFITTTRPNDALIEQLLPILEEASQILLQEYQNYSAGYEFTIQEKHDDSPVTQADLKVNRFLLKHLAEITPELPVLSEESDYSARHAWSSCWMLDPLDGTKEFIHERDEFTINLSLIEGRETIFSVIVVPCEQVVYLGYLKDLPFKYSFNQQQWYQYQKTPYSTQAPVQIGLSHSSKNPKYQKFIEPIEKIRTVIRREAGSAYKFCMMLEGEIDIYPRFHPTSEWDTSSGQGLLESIGGGLLTLTGKPFEYNQRDTVLNGGFIAFRDQESKKIAFEALAQSGVLD
ncbi:3'(2'),5'-bisphosphate nucleotidase CysQ [Acinetobacter baumannii]|uniref:3'(2'),5'-bisphosphate nucleotidase CysQ family protein n=1 Tax=Acinetobacter baumannii TaxID=470 RepID=UPI0021525B9E|nr:3'(2'),5'-bisphosphate nucleotidase CysQ [Acinetobacter baumannii]EIM5576729.1 3'(2'),5'-bisphosphate nucleotidase CysQ [Acinetobacter baumannii]EIO1628364.1 3'(2'),5'-bisphosphate nucleotidase CysQ [Acinetobacter baumannii]EKX8585260.1 3'(2'),5'-bisphosphate nucleotidase CysQ [Acinetobacter baumannii]MCR6567386.1 3'(2'),5'-bisphosphate nucleotidase CysQ [Acinetobacter baumannii]MDC5070972.1 3'(2'),5'-bisphosphate nucleotidase CysQ [Acinetobacter baumannii]